MSRTNTYLGDAPVQIIDGDRGKAYPKQTDLSDTGYCLFLNAGNVTRNGFSFDSCQYITERKDAELRQGRLARHDIVMTTRGTIGNVAYYGDGVPHDRMRINSGMVIFRCDEREMSPRFLYQYLRSPQFQGQVRAQQSGVAQPQLPIRDMKRIRLSLPKVAEQERIASILSAYDDLIENNRRRIELLEQAARLLYKEWFVHLRFPGHEHVRIQDGVPEGWERQLLGDAVVIKKGRNITRDSAKDGSVPVVAGGLEPAYFHDSANATGPVVTISASGMNAGYVHLYAEDIWASDCSYISSEATDLIYFYYLHLDARQREVFGLQKGAAQPHVYPKDLMRLPMICPPGKLTDAFEEKVSAIFLSMGNLNRQNKNLAAARDLLLPRLMSGEIAV